MQPQRLRRAGLRPGPTGRRLVLLAVLGVAVMILVTVQSRQETGPMDRALSRVTIPLLEVGRHTSDEATGVFGTVSRLWRAQQRVADLEDENARLKQDHARYRAVVQELRNLQQQVGIQPRIPYLYVPATVIVRDVDSLFDAVVLNLGSRDGIAVHMPVLAEGAVVGRIERVLPGASRVLLISDANSCLGVRVARSGVRGLLYGSLSRRNPALRLELERARPDDVRVGDEIVTAEESTLFPPGLPVGIVTKLRPPSVREETNAIVRPMVELKSLEYVQVLTSIERRDALVLAEDLATQPSVAARPLAEIKRIRSASVADTVDEATP